MRVRVRLFAALAEAAGAREIPLELKGDATARHAWERLVALHPRLTPLAGSVAVAINQAWTGWQAPLHEGDEVAFLPPVSGGLAEDEAGSEAVFLTEEPLSLDEVLARVRRPGVGGIVTFAGTVRELTGGRRTVHLEYQAYREMALAELAKVAREATARWPGVKLAIGHRLGTLAAGEVSVVVAAGAPHRPEAFAACRYAIDRLKETVPIWKKERWEDGEEWVGLPSQGQAAPGMPPSAPPIRQHSAPRRPGSP